jgi:hypothetical protein
VNGTDGNTSGGSLGVHYAFIQFAGFTKGKAVSQFDAPCSSRASQQETVKTWGFRDAYTHNWDPYWNTAIYGAYALAQFGTLAKTTPEVCRYRHRGRCDRDPRQAGRGLRAQGSGLARPAPPRSAQLVSSV